MRIQGKKWGVVSIYGKECVVVNITKKYSLLTRKCLALSKIHVLVRTIK